MNEGRTLFDLPLAPIPWSDPFFYISIIVIVAFGARIVYNLWNREE